jgi:hypothetical protein
MLSYELNQIGFLVNDQKCQFIDFDLHTKETIFKLLLNLQDSVNYEECIAITVENRICEYFIQKILQFQKFQIWDDIAHMLDDEEDFIDTNHSQWRRRVPVLTSENKYIN